MQPIVSRGFFELIWRGLECYSYVASIGPSEYVEHNVGCRPVLFGDIFDGKVHVDSVDLDVLPEFTQRAREVRAL